MTQVLITLQMNEV